MSVGTMKLLVAAFLIFGVVGPASANSNKPSTTFQWGFHANPFGGSCFPPDKNEGLPCPPCQHGKCTGICHGGFCDPNPQVK
jgi:hypothetical protein